MKPVQESDSVDEPDSADESDSSDSSSDFSESESESSDDVIALDERPSGWIEKPLDENTRLRLEEELRDLERHLAEMQDMHRRAEEACQELMHALNHLNICLKR